MPPATPAEARPSQGEHVIKFMRRQEDFDALRVAAGVVFTVAGVIKESLLLGEIAGEIHQIGRRLCGGENHDQEVEEEPRPLRPDEAAQGNYICKKRKKKPCKRRQHWKTKPPVQEARRPQTPPRRIGGGECWPQGANGGGQAQRGGG